MVLTDYFNLIRHYERQLALHKQGALAVNWKNEQQADIRYAVMLDLVRPSSEPVSLLDFGCGLAGLKDYIDRTDAAGIAYNGLDISPAFVTAARARFPGTNFLCGDALAGAFDWPVYDYVIMNGIFTRREDMTVFVMQDYFRRLLGCVFAHVGVGLAFNVMSKSVDWEDPALYHPDPGDVAQIISADLSRHYVMRNDYGLHETTWYVYREANQFVVGQGRVGGRVR